MSTDLAYDLDCRIRPNPGWTRARMLECIRKWVPTGPPAMNEGACVYQTLDKSYRCAAGAFLSDATIEAVLAAGENAGSIQDIPFAKGESEMNLPLSRTDLADLQTVHDNFGESAGALGRRHAEEYGSNPQEACVAWIMRNILPDDEEIQEKTLDS